MINLLDINPGDILLVASDVTRLAYNDPEFTCDKLIDELQEAVTPEGTLLFPTYNMDFCDGVPFDIVNTPSQMGSLSSAALARADFLRTRHPIYSFAVWGKYKEWFVNDKRDVSLADMAPIDKMLIIDVDYQHSFTYAHHIESIYAAYYRYWKGFEAGEQTAFMYVRNLEDGVESDLNKMGEELEYQLAAIWNDFDGVNYGIIYLDQAAHIIKKDILLNRGRNLHKDKYTELESYFDRLWPIMRSITGDGVRETHKILSEIAPLETIEIPSGTKVFDWVVPDEWEYNSAVIYDLDGRMILGVGDNNLHLVNGSEAMYESNMKNAELMQHLYSIPEKPTVIPYKTSYYKRDWGFCVSDYQKQRMTDDEYGVIIATKYKKGSMTISELVIPGETEEEIMFSAYTCHPSMANNELSGPLAVAFLARKILDAQYWSWVAHYTYRFVFLPETIGSLAYMATQDLSKVIAGYVVTCCGIDKPFVYKRTKDGFHAADDVAEYVLDGEVRDYYPDKGADERQYNAVGFPVGTIMTAPPGEYPEYHTSLDNKNLISFRAIQRTIDNLYRICEVFEMNKIYKNNYGNGEPSFQKHDITEDLAAVRWLLSMSDGRTDLLAIAIESKIDIFRLFAVAQDLERKQVLE